MRIILGLLTSTLVSNLTHYIVPSTFGDIEGLVLLIKPHPPRHEGQGAFAIPLRCVVIIISVHLPHLAAALYVGCWKGLHREHGSSNVICHSESVSNLHHSPCLSNMTSLLHTCRGKRGISKSMISFYRMNIVKNLLGGVLLLGRPGIRLLRTVSVCVILTRKYNNRSTSSCLENFQLCNYNKCIFQECIKAYFNS